MLEEQSAIGEFACTAGHFSPNYQLILSIGKNTMDDYLSSELNVLCSIFQIMNFSYAENTVYVVRWMIH